MHTEAISEKTQSVLEKIVSSGVLDGFYLVGGTALAIQLGHRESIDLDWFSRESFDSQKIKKTLSQIGDFQVTAEDSETLHGVLDEVKITFLGYEYPQLFSFVEFEKIALADERDIAAMKIDAVSSRGTKKDFLDLYFLLKKYSLEELFDFFEKKYSAVKYNKMHLLKSLVFFEDAEGDPMPRMLLPTDWEKAKKEIQKRTGAFIFDS